MLRTRNCKLSLCLGLLASLFLLILIATGSSFAADKPPFTVQTVLYRGTSYGVYADVGSTVLAGPTAQSSLQQPCGSDLNNELVTGTAAGVSLSPLLQGGAANTSNQSFPNQTSQSIADVVSVNLLGGLITAQEIKSVSTTSLDTNGFHLSAAGSTFTNLTVLGLPYNNTPAPNTRVDLPLIGYVVLNEQTSFTNNSEADLTVNMLHVYVTLDNLLGIPVGTEVVLASAQSGMVRAFAPAVITGTSFGTSVTLAGILSSTPTAPVNLPCYGTAGQTITNSVATLNLPGVLGSATVTDTGKSALTFPYSTGTMTTRVENLNLLNSLVTVGVLAGRVDGTIAGPQGVFKTAVGSFVNLAVAGHPEINDNVAYNTSVDILGLGTLYLKHVIRQSPNPSTIEIRMIELVVNQTNVFNLPIGADVIVGDAQLGIVPASEP
jgi:hypothetical protein